MKKSIKNLKWILGSLMVQHDNDIHWAKQLCELYNIEDVPIYDTSVLRGCLVNVVCSWFEGYHALFELNHFIYDLDFGRKSNSNSPIEELWNSLNSNTKACNEEDTKVLEDELIDFDIPTGTDTKDPFGNLICKNKLFENPIPIDGKLYWVRLNQKKDFRLCLYSSSRRLFIVVNSKKSKTYDVDYTHIEFKQAIQ